MAELRNILAELRNILVMHAGTYRIRCGDRSNCQKYILCTDVTMHGGIEILLYASM